jgi:hypothetical protein
MNYTLADVTQIRTLESQLVVYNSEAKVRNLLLSPATNLTINLEMPINYRNQGKTLHPLTINSLCKIRHTLRH